jgi:hypothetical protein
MSFSQPWWLSLFHSSGSRVRRIGGPRWGREFEVKELGWSRIYFHIVIDDQTLCGLSPEAGTPSSAVPQPPICPACERLILTLE